MCGVCDVFGVRYCPPKAAEHNLVWCGGSVCGMRRGVCARVGWHVVVAQCCVAVCPACECGCAVCGVNFVVCGV